MWAYGCVAMDRGNDKPNEKWVGSEALTEVNVIPETWNNKISRQLEPYK